MQLHLLTCPEDAAVPVFDTIESVTVVRIRIDVKIR